MRLRVPVFWRRLQGDEVADRHLSQRGRDAQLVEALQVALVKREAQPDIEFFVGIIGTVFGKLDPVGDHLDGIAQQGDIGAVAGGLFTIDMQPPFDARQRPAVFDIDKATDACVSRPRMRSNRGAELCLDRAR